MSWTQKKQNNPIPIQTKQNIRGYTASIGIKHVWKYTQTKFAVYRIPSFSTSPNAITPHPTTPHPLHSIDHVFKFNERYYTPSLFLVNIHPLHQPATNRGESLCIPHKMRLGFILTQKIICHATDALVSYYSPPDSFCFFKQNAFWGECDSTSKFFMCCSQPLPDPASFSKENVPGSNPSGILVFSQVKGILGFLGSQSDCIKFYVASPCRNS